MSRKLGLLAGLMGLFGASMIPDFPVAGNPARKTLRNLPSSRNTLSIAEQTKLKGFKEFNIEGHIYYAATKKKAIKLHQAYKDSI